MESTRKFVQNRVVFLNFTASNRATANINIPFEVDRIVFRSLAYDSNVAEYAVLTSDLIQWNGIGVCFRDSTFSNSTAQTNEYHFQTPTKINGQYNFQLSNLDGTFPTIGGAEFAVFIAEFIRDPQNGHSH
jgi:hypothetical protein